MVVQEEYTVVAYLFVLVEHDGKLVSYAVHVVLKHGGSYLNQCSLVVHCNF